MGTSGKMAVRGAALGIVLMLASACGDSPSQDRPTPAQEDAGFDAEPEEVGEEVGEDDPADADADGAEDEGADATDLPTEPAVASLCLALCQELDAQATEPGCAFPNAAGASLEGCVDTCAAQGTQDRAWLASWACFSHGGCSSEACFPSDEQPLVIDEACERACASAQACDALGLLGFDQEGEGLGLCRAVCTGQVTADPGLGDTYACLRESFDQTCSQHAAVDGCIDAFPGLCDVTCRQRLDPEALDGAPHPDRCAPDSPLGRAFADAGACSAACDALAGEARLTYAGCLMLNGCEDPTACSAPSEHPLGACEDACRGLTALCGADADLPDPYTCRALCDGLLDAMGTAEAPDAATCIASLGACPTEAPYETLLQCVTAIPPRCQEVCPGIGACNAAALGTDPEAEVADCRFGCAWLSSHDPALFEDASRCLSCLPPPCSDGVQNGDETDVDCGGSRCAPCGLEQGCAQDPDCRQGLCDAGLCLPGPGCFNGFQDGDETDRDCGGPRCQGCLAGQRCLATGDCARGTCEGGSCAGAADCFDGVQNRDETGVDCGGACAPCPDPCLAPDWDMFDPDATSCVGVALCLEETQTPAEPGHPPPMPYEPPSSVGTPPPPAGTPQDPTPPGGVCGNTSTPAEHTLRLDALAAQHLDPRAEAVVTFSGNAVGACERLEQPFQAQAGNYAIVATTTDGALTIVHIQILLQTPPLPPQVMAMSPPGQDADTAIIDLWGGPAPLGAPARVVLTVSGQGVFSARLYHWR